MADNPRPFVPTSIARNLLSRLALTHEECAISVISGPWGIGKTRTLDEFYAANEATSLIVKVEPGPRGKGAAPARVLQFIAEGLQRAVDPRGCRVRLGNGYLQLRQAICDYLSIMFDHPEGARFTFIFDEAQNLSREAIETLRYWNDADRCTTPFPVGLFFVGNNEFAMQSDRSGESVISGAVRSRALFIESLDYSDVSEADLVLFAESRGIADAAVISAIVRYYSSPKTKPDFRTLERSISVIQRLAGSGPVTAEILQTVLSPL
ncbi:MAG TPA: ATP-binding protein [Allosphingosinicella sp.]|jgi:hypothetical protein